MTLTIPQEKWPAPGPRGVAYLVGMPKISLPAWNARNPSGVLSRPAGSPWAPKDYLAAYAADVDYLSRLTADWMNGRLVGLLPGAKLSAGAMAAAVLFSASDQPPAGAAIDANALAGDAVYIRFNVDPSEQYVQSVPGSTRRRLSPDGSGIRNLFLAGDWTRTGINAGCAEAAVMSGRIAAGAIADVRLDVPGASDFPPQAPRLVRRMPSGAAAAPNATRSVARSFPGLAGDLTSHIVVLPIPESAVRSMLPPGLELAPQTWIGGGDHPVVVAFSEQRNVRPSILPVGGADYLEFVEVIPYVRARGSNPDATPFSYYPYLLVSRLLPVALGRIFYGFNKRPAIFRHVAGSFVIRSHLGRPIEARFEPQGAEGRFADYPDLSTARDAMEQPVIAVGPFGAWVYSQFDFDFDQATVQPVDCRLQIGQPFATGLRPGARSHVSAFRLRTRWRLASPLASPSIKWLAERAPH